MINKPSLLDSPNLINGKEYTPSDIPGSSVDDCYANDSTIRQNYDGTDMAEWNTGKQVQETLPAAEWDAFIHDIGAIGWQFTEVINSIYEELYSAIHGQQTGMPHELLDKLDALSSETATLTNKTISISSNSITGTASKMLQTDANGRVVTTSEYADNYLTTTNTKTITNKTISFDDNTLQNVASLDTAQTLTNKTISYADNTMPGVQPTLTPGTGIDITGTTISAKKVYSTSEQLTGDIWIDGRPIYRKTYSFTTPEAPTGSVLSKNFLVDSSFLPTYFMVSCFGFINASGGSGYTNSYTIPYTEAGVVTVQGTSVHTVQSSVHPYVYKPFISGTAGLYLSFFGQDASLYQKPAALTVEYVKE